MKIKAELNDTTEVTADLTGMTCGQAMTFFIELMKFSGYQERNIWEACREYAETGDIYY